MAKRIDLNVKHQLSPEEALERVRALGDYYENRHGAAVAWNGSIGHIKAKWLTMHADIEFRVTNSSIQLDGPDPGLLLRGRVTKYLKRKLETYLDPGTPLESLPRS